MDAAFFDFDAFWLSGPWLKLGKKNAARHFRATVKTRDDFNRIQGARDKYIVHLACHHWKTPQHGSTWFNNWQDWVEYEEVRQKRLTADDPGYYDGFNAD